MFTIIVVYTAAAPPRVPPRESRGARMGTTSADNELLRLLFASLRHQCALQMPEDLLPSVGLAELHRMPRSALVQHLRDQHGIESLLDRYAVADAVAAFDMQLEPQEAAELAASEAAAKAAERQRRLDAEHKKARAGHDTPPPDASHPRGTNHAFVRQLTAALNQLNEVEHSEELLLAADHSSTMTNEVQLRGIDAHIPAVGGIAPCDGPIGRQEDERLAMVARIDAWKRQRHLPWRSAFWGPGGSAHHCGIQ